MLAMWFSSERDLYQIHVGVTAGAEQRRGYGTCMKHTT
jgi:hypothetical protein